MFTLFTTDIKHCLIPEVLTLTTTNKPHELCLLAASELQHYLSQNEILNHNFGLQGVQDSTVIGKMFGILVVQLPSGELGYLSAFSGKLGGRNTYPKFVPPVFDLLTEGSFLNLGMQELTRMNCEIRLLSSDDSHLRGLKVARRNHSTSLQNEIFERYHLLNQAGIYALTYLWPFARPIASIAGQTVLSQGSTATFGGLPSWQGYRHGTAMRLINFM